MIEIGLAALGGLGIGGALLRWMYSGPSGSVRRGFAAVILGGGGPAVPEK